MSMSKVANFQPHLPEDKPHLPEDRVREVVFGFYVSVFSTFSSASIVNGFGLVTLIC